MLIVILSVILINLIIIKYFNQISKYINLFDHPDDNRKIHTKKVALLGGSIVFVNLSLYYLLSPFLINNIEIDYSLGVFSFFIFILGLLDDKYKINSNLKFLLFIIFSYLLLKIDNNLIIFQLNFSFLENNISLGKFSLFFSIFALIIFLNAFNMFDGINLQSSIYAIFIFCVFILNNIYIEFSIIIIFSLSFFIYLNYKNISFLGDNGSLLIAFLISYIFFQSSSKEIFYADEILLIMLIPGLDLIRLFFTRLIQAKSPFTPDDNHFHHHLLKKFGLIKTNLIVFLLISISYTLASITNQFLLLIVIVLFIYFFILWYLRKNIYEV